MQPVTESATLLDLLVQWEELRRQGKTVTPEELCPDDARMQALLRERLARRERLYAALDLPTVTPQEPVVRPASLPVIDGYEIGELLGRGGMGLVFRAVQTALKRPVALKLVVSGGFTLEKIREFERDDVPVDAYGVGSSLIRGSNDSTGDSVVTDGLDGVLVEPGDRQALTASLRALLVDAGERVRIGQSARRAVTARFSLAETAAAYLTLYRDLTSCAASPAR